MSLCFTFFLAGQLLLVMCVLVGHAHHVASSWRPVLLALEALSSCGVAVGAGPWDAEETRGEGVHRRLRTGCGLQYALRVIVRPKRSLSVAATLRLSHHVADPSGSGRQRQQSPSTCSQSAARRLRRCGRRLLTRHTRALQWHAFPIAGGADDRHAAEPLRRRPR